MRWAASPCRQAQTTETIEQSHHLRGLCHLKNSRDVTEVAALTFLCYGWKWSAFQRSEGENNHLYFVHLNIIDKFLILLQKQLRNDLILKVTHVWGRVFGVGHLTTSQSCGEQRELPFKKYIWSAKIKSAIVMYHFFHQRASVRILTPVTIKATSAA